MPFLPLHDDNPTTITPFVTYAVIGLCIVVFAWQMSLLPSDAEAAVYAFGAIPAVLLGDVRLAPGVAAVPSWATLVTSMFLHGDPIHLGANMLYLWIFGNNVEDAMGHVRFIAFYLICGVLAGLTHALIDPASTVPVIGASGAISGVLGAYLLLHPQARILVLIVLPVFVRLPAWLVLVAWFVGQGLAALTAGTGGGVAWWAHIGGFVAGMALMVPFRRPSVVLFDRGKRGGPAGRPHGPWG
jgi:membrane associated rhomboid family serine protease